MELSNTRPENTRKKYFKNCQNIYRWQVLYCDARLACGLRAEAEIASEQWKM